MSNYSKSLFDPANTNNSWYKALQLIPKKSYVLDVGCSSGSFGEVLTNEWDCLVDGIEINEKDAMLASKKLRKVYRLNIETDNLKIITQRYDAIYFGDVIEHLVDPVNALKNVKKILKPNGRIIFSIPNMAHLMIRLELLKGDFEYTETGILDKTHLHFYTLKEIQRIFSESGYEIKKIDYTIKDYPNELIDEYLIKIGLKADKKFFDMMRQTDAAAFQFVGYSISGKTVRPKRLNFGPIDLFESFFNNTVGPLRKEIIEINDKLEKLTVENTQLKVRLDYVFKHPVGSATRSIINKIGNNKKP
jgi:2-polyprenyl-3-methyl-5-hydroxy-6-metoxy-1,4-benzoquinol methylase